MKITLTASNLIPLFNDTASITVYQKGYNKIYFVFCIDHREQAFILYDLDRNPNPKTQIKIPLSNSIKLRKDNFVLVKDSKNNDLAVFFNTGSVIFETHINRLRRKSNSSKE